MATKTLADRLAKATTNPYGVAAGQVWRNCDPRMHGSTTKVVSVEGAYATVAYFFEQGNDRGRRQVRLDRFHKCANGFERVS